LSWETGHRSAAFTTPVGRTTSPPGWGIVATIEYVQLELGAEPSASVLFLVAALLAIAVFLASLETPS
jgi:hypothetical protein